VTTFPFLSDEWIAAAEDIHDEYAGRFDSQDEVVRVNVVVTDIPFGDGHLNGHIDTSDGNTRPQKGHINNPEATVSVPYEIARSIFVTQDFEAVAMAFMTGQLEVQGDVTRLLYLQDLDPTPDQMELGAEVAHRLLAITDSSA